MEKARKGLRGPGRGGEGKDGAERALEGSESRGGAERSGTVEESYGGLERIRECWRGPR